MENWQGFPLPSDYPFRSVFLDTNVVRYLATLPSYFYEAGADEEDQTKLAQITSTKLRTDIDVLRALPNLSARGIPHALVITRDVVEELPLGARQFGENLLSWCIEIGSRDEYTPKNFFDGLAEVLDASDRQLYLQAVALGCDTFLTTDYRTIVKRRDDLPRYGTRIMTPSEWWQQMRPWAGLYL